jgi:hypothetical protein
MPHRAQENFAAFVGIDWADAKHDICLQAVGSATRECRQLDHKPEAIDAWARALQERFAGRPVAVGLELNKGPLVYALRKYDFLQQGTQLLGEQVRLVQQGSQGISRIEAANNHED